MIIERLKGLRKSRHIYRAVSLFLLVLSAASLALLAGDRWLFQSDAPSRLPDEKSSVGFGVQGVDRLEPYNAVNRPYFNFCPVENGKWRIRFNWQIDASADPQKFIETAPTVVLTVPDDATGITPEKTVASDPETGVVQRGGHALTSVTESTSPPGERRLSLRPIALARATDGSPRSNVAYYGAYFETSSMDRGRDGLAKRHFKLSLAQRPTGTEAVPSSYIPKYKEPGTLEFILCSSDDGRKGAVDTDSLYPAPDQALERGKLTWGTLDSSSFSVSGNVSGGILPKIVSNAGWFAANSFAAALGAVYGAGLEKPLPDPPAPNTTKGPSNQAAKGRTPPGRATTPERSAAAPAPETKRRRKKGRRK
jgi:hypothetical protein